MDQRIRVVNLFIILVVVAIAVTVQRIVALSPIIGQVPDLIFVYLSSIGFYQLLIKITSFAIEKNRFFLKLYWGKMYVDGFWSYYYTIDCDDDKDQVYMGVWKFEQDLYATRVVGFGLDDKLRVRSRVRSLTDLHVNDGMYYVVNARSDANTLAQESLSKTTMFFELGSGTFAPIPMVMRGTTIMFGGPRDGCVCNNYFRRHIDARTEEDVIARMRSSANSDGDNLKLAQVDEL